MHVTAAELILIVLTVIPAETSSSAIAQRPRKSTLFILLSSGYNWNKTETKLKQNKRKTIFRFSEIVLFQFCFSVFTCETKR